MDQVEKRFPLIVCVASVTFPLFEILVLLFKSTYRFYDLPVPLMMVSILSVYMAVLFRRGQIPADPTNIALMTVALVLSIINGLFFILAELPTRSCLHS